jgi:cytochrome P450
VVICSLLLAAGAETTPHLIDNTALPLLEHPTP